MIEVRGAEPGYEAHIRRVLSSLPAWYVQSARVSRFVVNTSREVREQMAMYRHGTRDVLLAPAAGNLLQRALAHELAHGCDDEGPANPHRWSRTPDWMGIWKTASTYEIPKYRDEPQEYFADQLSKVVLLGAEKLQLSCPRETQYMVRVVLPVLMAATNQR